MHAKERELILRDEVYSLVSCAIEVLNVDLVVHEKVIVDTKTIDRITDHERGQMLNYLRITALPVAVILNFKYARLGWERLVLSNTSTRAAVDGGSENVDLLRA